MYEVELLYAEQGRGWGGIRSCREIYGAEMGLGKMKGRCRDVFLGGKGNKMKRGFWRRGGEQAEADVKIGWWRRQPRVRFGD